MEGVTKREREEEREGGTEGGREERQLEERIPGFPQVLLSKTMTSKPEHSHYFTK